jgi:phosphate transport system substrate-binding protein
MNTTFKKSSGALKIERLRLIAVSLALCLLLPACSEKKDSAQQSAPSGKLLIRGSNTIGEELGPRLISAYKKDHPVAAVEIESKGTGYGIAALLAGQCEIAAASRLPIQEELGLAKERGIELSDYPIGSYSVAVIVNAACPVQNLTKEQVRDIFIGTVQNWKDVGGPDAPIHLCGRDPISGTHLGFREVAMENQHYASGLKTFTNYAAIVETVAQDQTAIGYCSMDLAKSGVKAVSIGGVPATTASVKEGKYPYARVLRFYTNKAKEAGSAKEFIEFVQSAKGQQIVAETGNVPKS